MAKKKATGRLTMSVGVVSVRVDGVELLRSEPVKVDREVRDGRLVDITKKKGKKAR